MKDFAYIAFYDLDHTILADNSATYLVEEARKLGIMNEKRFRHAIWLSILYKLGIGDPSQMIERMLSWVSGLEEKAILDLCQDIFNERIKRRIRPEILRTFEEHRSDKGGLVLLSSASFPICDPVSRYLEMDDMICTHLESENGYYTGHTRGKVVYGPEKQVRMLDYCRENGYNPAEAWYYGDSHTDKYVMSAVGYPVAVSPDRRLKQIALQKNWQILIDDR